MLNNYKRKFFPHADLSTSLLPPCGITEEGIDTLKKFGCTQLHIGRKDINTAAKLSKILGTEGNMDLKKMTTTIKEEGPQNALDTLTKKLMARRQTRISESPPPVSEKFAPTPRQEPRVVPKLNFAKRIQEATPSRLQTPPK